MEPLRILLVENDLDILHVIEVLLQMDGHTVTCAVSYNEGLKLIEKEKFDIVITDWRMPGMSGLHLLEMAKYIQPKMPVIVMSAYHSNELEDEAHRRHVDAIIKKPFELADLTALMEKVTQVK